MYRGIHTCTHAWVGVYASLGSRENMGCIGGYIHTRMHRRISISILYAGILGRIGFRGFWVWSRGSGYLSCKPPILDH